MQKNKTDHIHTLFDNMDKWRHLPAYQLERRADIFFSIYLSDILSDKLNINVEGIIPEFPIRIGSINKDTSTNQSFKVDYLIKTKDINRIILIELKTDDSSRRDGQDEYLDKAQQAGFIKLLEGVADIYKATNSKKKYGHLLGSLQKMGFVTMENNAIKVIPANYTMEIIYIQPNNHKQQPNIISFHEVAQIINRHNDELSTRFASSLRTWAELKAGD